MASSARAPSALRAALRQRRAALPQAGRRFIEGFSWIALFFVGARLASVAAQFVAARLLGPDEYGRAHLVIAVASAAQALPMLGFPFALARFGGSVSDQNHRDSITAATLAAFLVWAAAALAGLWASGSALFLTTNLLPSLWTPCLALAGATALHLTLGGALQGLGRFRQRGVAEALYSLSALALLGAALAGGRRDASAFVQSVTLGLCAAGAYELWLLRGQLGARLRLAPLRDVLPFATLGTVMVVSAALIQAPGRIILFHLDSARAAGVYSAYFTATVQVALSLGNMVQAVLIPLASRSEGQHEAWNLLRRWGPRAALGLPAAFAAVASLAMLLLGRSYPLVWSWTALFSLAATAVLGHGVLAALFAARDLRGLVVSIAGSLGAGLLNLIITMSLAPHLGVAGAALGLAVGHGAGIGIYLLFTPRAASPGAG